MVITSVLMKWFRDKFKSGWTAEQQLSLCFILFYFYFYWCHPVSFDSVAPASSYLLTFFFLPNLNSLSHMLRSVGQSCFTCLLSVVGSCGMQAYIPEHKYVNKSFFLLNLDLTHAF